jgi:hypothetical protein
VRHAVLEFAVETSTAGLVLHHRGLEPESSGVFDGDRVVEQARQMGSTLVCGDSGAGRSAFEPHATLSSQSAEVGGDVLVALEGLHTIAELRMSWNEAHG